MANLSDIQLRRLDLTLLLVFEAAMETKKLRLVAAKLGLTPSAISHALTRLRDIFDDPLFVRRPDGVVATRRAHELLPQVKTALTSLRGALGLGVFDPKTLSRVFKIAALDYAVVIMGPGLIHTVRKQAPGVQLSFLSMGRMESLDAVERGSVDASIGVFPTVSDRLELKTLTADRFVTVARRKHPALVKGMTLANYLTLDHIVVSGSGELSTVVDTHLAALGKSRRVVAALPQFLASLATVVISDAVASVPEKLALRYAKKLGLDMHQFPLTLPGFEVSAAVAKDTDQGLAWLIDLIAKEFDRVG